MTLKSGKFYSKNSILKQSRIAFESQNLPNFSERNWHFKGLTVSGYLRDKIDRIIDSNDINLMSEIYTKIIFSIRKTFSENLKKEQKS